MRMMVMMTMVMTAMTTTDDDVDDTGFDLSNMLPSLVPACKINGRRTRFFKTCRDFLDILGIILRLAEISWTFWASFCRCGFRDRFDFCQFLENFRVILASKFHQKSTKNASRNEPKNMKRVTKMEAKIEVLGISLASGTSLGPPGRPLDVPGSIFNDLGIDLGTILGAVWAHCWVDFNSCLGSSF